MTKSKLTDGLNDRPKDAPIGQTAEGLPDDGSRPVDVDDQAVDAVRKKLSEDPREKLIKDVKQGEDASRGVTDYGRRQRQDDKGHVPDT